MAEDIYKHIYSKFLTPEEAIVKKIGHNHYTIELGPFERGFGHTLGAPLRRIFLSSIPGAAVVSVQIKDVLHEYSTVPGVSEDVIDILLNLKGLAIKLHREENTKLVLKKSKLGPILAGDIKPVAGVDIINPEHHIATLAKGYNFEMELEVALGRGYVPALSMANDASLEEEQVIGRLLLDASFSPVRRFVYRVENTRVGKRTDLDKLILDLETNGALGPQEAIRCAASILHQQLLAFSTFTLEPDEEKESVEEELNPSFLRPIGDLELTARASNCLRAENIHYIGDLVQRSRSDLIRTPNLGKITIGLIEKVLEGYGLHLGMKVDNWASRRDACKGSVDESDEG